MHRCTNIVPIHPKYRPSNAKQMHCHYKDDCPGKQHILTEKQATARTHEKEEHYPGRGPINHIVRSSWQMHPDYACQSGIH